MAEIIEFFDGDVEFHFEVQRLNFQTGRVGVPPAEVARSGITPDYGQLADDGWLWLSDGRIRAVPEGAGHLDQMVLTVQDEGNGCVRLDFRCECCGSTEAPLLVGKRFQPKPTPPNDDPYGSAKLLAKLRERT